MYLLFELRRENAGAKKWFPGSELLLSSSVLRPLTRGMKRACRMPAGRKGPPRLSLLALLQRRPVMLGRNEYSRATSAHVGDIERRLRSIERRFERVCGRASASATQAADHAGEVIASALSGIAERFRGDASGMAEEAAKIGSAAVKLGDNALHRLSKEVEHRPLVTLAVAIGVGILVGLASHGR